MITSELMNNAIPRLQLQDTVHKALQLMADYRVSHLPVVADDNYLGLLSEEDLLDAEDTKQPVQMLVEHFSQVAVLDNVFFINAVQLCNQFDISVLPVVNAGRELLGVITLEGLLKATGNFAGANHTGGIVVLEITPAHFSISEISRIIENNDCTLLHLNTQMNETTGFLTVTLQVNKKELAALIATFERYEYNVVLYFGHEKFENEIKSNYDHLINYLNI